MAEKKVHRRGRRKPNKIKIWFQGLDKRKKTAVCIGGAVICLVLIALIFLLIKLSKLNTDDISSDDIIVNENVLGEGYTNVALFGIDSRTGELEVGTRTDCLIVASLNNETKEVRMVSVYRDTVLDIEDNYLQKCNAAYAFGGPTQAINMLNKNLDLNIQEYATVDFAAISNAIDMLGGLEIEIKPEEIKPLNKFVKETARVAGKEAHTVSEPGLQHLDGVQATTYARIRSTAGGDFTRTERQRLVIEKIVEKAQKSDLVTINKIIDELFPTIKTSFTATEILAYAKDFAKYHIGESAGFPFEKTTATISGLGSIVIPVTLSENVSELHKFLYDEENYVPSATVETINSAIIARVGQREATDYSTLSNQTYVDTEEDKAQEHNEYSPPPVTDNDVDDSIESDSEDKDDIESQPGNDESTEESETPSQPDHDENEEESETPTQPDHSGNETPPSNDDENSDGGSGGNETPPPSDDGSDSGDREPTPETNEAIE